MTAYAKTVTAAERGLLQKLQDRAKTGQAGELTAMHKLTHLLAPWEAKFEEQIADRKRSPTSLDTYRRVRQPPGHGVAWRAFAAVTAAPPVRFDDPAYQH